MADPLLDTYRTACKNASGAPLSPEQVTREVAAGLAKITGLTEQMKDIGRSMVDAESDLVVAQGAGDAAAEISARARLSQAQSLLKENFELRKFTVTRLRALGQTVTDPYVP